MGRPSENRGDTSSFPGRNLFCALVIVPSQLYYTKLWSSKVCTLLCQSCVQFLHSFWIILFFLVKILIRVISCIFMKLLLSPICTLEDLPTAMCIWPLLRRAPFMQIVKDQGSLNWPFLLLRQILAGGNKMNMSRC